MLAINRAAFCKRRMQIDRWLDPQGREDRID